MGEKLSQPTWTWIIKEILEQNLSDNKMCNKQWSKIPPHQRYRLTIVVGGFDGTEIMFNCLIISEVVRQILTTPQRGRLVNFVFSS